MGRRRLPFERTRKGYRCNLDSEERYLLRRLLGEVRELLATTPPDDPKMHRLFPPAYDRPDDADADADYRRLMHDELVASRLESMTTIEAVLADDDSDSAEQKSITPDQLHAFAKSLNSVRLILGSLLGISDEDDDELPGVAPENMALYHYLSWLLESAVSALASEFD